MDSNGDGSARDSMQVGLLCDPEGRPVSVEVCTGNGAGPASVAVQADKLRKRFGLNRVVLVADGVMLASERMREDLFRYEDLGWISSTPGVGHPPASARGTALGRKGPGLPADAGRECELPWRAAAGVPRSTLAARASRTARYATCRTPSWNCRGYAYCAWGVQLEELDDEGAVRAYESLAVLERSFRRLEFRGLGATTVPGHGFPDTRALTRSFLCWPPTWNGI